MSTHLLQSGMSVWPALASRPPQGGRWEEAGGKSGNYVQYVCDKQLRGFISVSRSHSRSRSQHISSCTQIAAARSIAWAVRSLRGPSVMPSTYLGPRGALACLGSTQCEPRLAFMQHPC
jgi:hypothetical protein